MNDDFNTAKVLANLFDLVSVINSMKDGLIPTGAVSEKNFDLLKKKFKDYLEDIFGLKAASESNSEKMTGVMDLLIEIRKDAKNKKDFGTSDKIRNQLKEIGILLKG